VLASLRMAAGASSSRKASGKGLPAGYGPHNFIMSLRQDRLNERDQELADRGYYEGLLDRGNLAFSLWTRHDWFASVKGRVTDQQDELLSYELKASLKSTVDGLPFITNRWRMRDEDYEQAKSPSTYRIALVGASYEMGVGLANGEAYESILERLLNRKHSDGQYSRYEILNFSVAGYSMVHKAIVTETRLALFDPDLVIVTVYSTEHGRLLIHIAGAVAKNVPIPYPGLRDIIERAEASPRLGADWIRARLEPYVYDMIEWSFLELKADSEKLGLPLVVLFLPTTTDKDNGDAEDHIGRLWTRRECGPATRAA
jgi:hypothetical protein